VFKTFKGLPHKTSFTVSIFKKQAATTPDVFWSTLNRNNPIENAVLFIRHTGA
jgi:hypothetical protein